MFAELVCRDMSAVKWHDGALISKGIVKSPISPKQVCKPYDGD